MVKRATSFMATVEDKRELVDPQANERDEFDVSQESNKFVNNIAQ